MKPYSHHRAFLFSPLALIGLMAFPCLTLAQTANLGPIEAEAAQRSGTFQVGSDPAASGGQFVWAPNGTGDSKDAINQANRLRFTFTVAQQLPYKLRARVHSVVDVDDSFWIRIDNRNDWTFLWDLPNTGTGFRTVLATDRGNGTPTVPQTKNLAVLLTPGTHTVDFFVREDGTQIDNLELLYDQGVDLVKAENCVASGSFSLGIEAIPGEHPPVHYMWPPIGSGNFLTAPNPANSLTCNLTVPKAGAYFLKAELVADNDAHNSFWVKVDGAPANGYLWEMTETHLSFDPTYVVPDYLSDRGAGNSTNPAVDPVVLNLAAGNHTVQILAREEGTRISTLGLEPQVDVEMRNLSLNRPTTSSSNENATLVSAKAVDGATGTRWSSLYTDDQWLTVDLLNPCGIDRVVVDWEVAFAKTYEIQASYDNKNWVVLYRKENNLGGVNNLMVNGRARYVRMRGIQRGTQWGYSLREFTVYGRQMDETPGNLSRSVEAVATASSIQGVGFEAAKAIDTGSVSRWSSQSSDDQWIYVDLGERTLFTGVKLTWEAAYAKSFQIQTSEDAISWTTLYSTTTGSGGVDEIAVRGERRYIRMKGVSRGTSFGYSLFDFALYGLSY